MLRYILRRLAGAAVVLTLLSFLVFSLLYLVPGDPVKILVGTRRLTPEVRQAVTARYGLDEPLVVRYWHWLTRAITGDFGDSVRSATPVTDVLASRVSLTAWLTIGAFILAVAVGIPLGIAAARRRGSWVDRTIVGWSVVGVSAPGFALGLVLLYVFGLRLGWFPVFGEGTGLVDTLWHLTLPAIALATGIGAMLVRITRAAVGATGSCAHADVVDDHCSSAVGDAHVRGHEAVAALRCRRSAHRSRSLRSANQSPAMLIAVAVTMMASPAATDAAGFWARRARPSASWRPQSASCAPTPRPR